MNRIKRFLKSFRDIFNRLYLGYRFKMVGLSGLGILSGFLDGLGISLLVPLFSVLLGGSYSDNQVSRATNAVFGYFHVTPSFRVILILVVLVFVIKAALLFWFGHVRIRVISDYTHSTKSKLYSSFLNARYPTLLKQKLGHFSEIVTGDVKISSRLLEYVMQTLLSVTQLVTYLAVAFVLDWKVTLWSLTLGAVMILIYSVYALPLTSKYALIATYVKRKMNHLINESVLGAKAIKTLGSEASVLESANLLFEEAALAEVKKMTIMNISKVAIEPVSIIFIMVVFSVAYLTKSFSLSAFLPIMYLIQQVFIRIDKIQSALYAISVAKPHSEVVLKSIIEIGQDQENNFGSDKFSFADKLEFNNVSFSYNTLREALTSISFSIRKGEILAILGSSGSGKTTIADLILRLISPQSGFIKLDGLSIDKIELKNWRREVAYVTQDVFLMDGTIADNIKFYDDTITDEQMFEAAKMANINDFIEGLPQQYLTKVGDRGNRLSGGEKQRVVLARILARRPQILILDEATSSLDNESENEIRRSIAALKGKVTMIIIAHRLSSISGADQILVIAKGKKLEEGSPEELLAKSDSYFSRISRAGILFNDNIDINEIA